MDYDWPVQVSKYLARGKHDLILSIGQVVPHEVAGMAGYNKNIFVGTGGKRGNQQKPLYRRRLRHGAHHGARQQSRCATL